MFFSGTVRMFRCDTCGDEQSQQYSTAFLYWIALIALSCAVTLPTTGHRIGHHLRGWYALLFVAAEVTLLALLQSIATRGVNRRVFAGCRCPKCAGHLQLSGSGFYDGLLPAAIDVLVGIGFVIVQVPILMFHK